MRIISLVPSWTETLIRSGISPVGRTRFCIHPPSFVKNIPIVGGTKAVNWEKVSALKPDLVLMDKEENTLTMAQECPFPVLSTHVTDWASMTEGLECLHHHLGIPALEDLIQRAKLLSHRPPRTWNQAAIPGFIQWLKEPERHYSQVSYLIWRDPWMAIQPNTFIGDILHRLGAKVLKVSDDKYPRVDLAQLADSLLLFSSEPFPFARFTDELRKLDGASALVDGEPFSWYGVRAIEFLESH